MEYIIKACGIIMVIFATTAYGMVLCADLKKRLSELKEIKKIIFLLIGEISFGHTPFFEAAGMISGRVSKPFDAVLKRLEGEGRDMNGENAASVWKKVWKKESDALSISSHERERLYELGESLGLSDADTQKRALEEYAKELETEISGLEKSVPVKTRLYGSLGIMCGVFIAIIIV